MIFFREREKERKKTKIELISFPRPIIGTGGDGWNVSNLSTWALWSTGRRQMTVALGACKLQAQVQVQVQVQVRRRSRKDQGTLVGPAVPRSERPAGMRVGLGGNQ